MEKYIHGYTELESLRLTNQARTLAELLHHDSIFPENSRVLEVGCGTGAQTVFLARQNPGVAITAIDISLESLESARDSVDAAGCGNVVFEQSDLFNLPFKEQSFDHIFVCFVLEHLDAPVQALTILKKFLRPGGSLTVIEGDHGSVFFAPASDDAVRAIGCQIELQARSGGNANIGRELYPLLREAGFASVAVAPRMVYVDASRPWLVEGFTKNTFTAMIEGVREKAIQSGLITAELFDKGIADLYRTTEDDGVFCYTFFKALAVVKN